jgi:hypothetical protein
MINPLRFDRRTLLERISRLDATDRWATHARRLPAPGRRSLAIKPAAGSAWNDATRRARVESLRRGNAR